MVRANSTCFGRQVAVRVVAELLAEHQNAVERRAQLVRHVGQEFRLVLRGQRQLFGLLFQGAAGLLDFLVLAFDFHVLFGELLGLLRQLFVGLLQFFLLGLKFGGQLLRLLQQALGLHRGLNAVEHDADAGSQLFEERQVRSGESAQRGQLDHRLNAVFEQHRQHDDVSRSGFEQARADGDVPSGGKSVISMRVSPAAHCPTRPSPNLQSAQVPVLAVAGKGREQHHAASTPQLPSGRSRLAGH